MRAMLHFAIIFLFLLCVDSAQNNVRYFYASENPNAGAISQRGTANAGGITHEVKLDQAVNPRNGIDYFYHTDDLYNVTAVTDAAGNVVESYDYDDYGRPTVFGNPAIGNPYRFTGRRYDDETGWYYYRTRYLEPVAGRFTTRDLLGYVNGMSLYTYAENNPINAIDPTGTQRSGTPFADTSQTDAESFRNRPIDEQLWIVIFGSKPPWRSQSPSQPNKSNPMSLDLPPDFWEPDSQPNGSNPMSLNLPPGFWGEPPPAPNNPSEPPCAPDGPDPDPPCVDCDTVVRQYGRVVVPCQIWPPCN